LYGEVALFSEEGKRGKNKEGRRSTSSENKAWELELIADGLSEMKGSIGNEAWNRLGRV